MVKVVIGFRLSVPRALSPQIELPPAATGCTSTSHQTSALMHPLQAALYWLLWGAMARTTTQMPQWLNVPIHGFFHQMKEMTMTMMTMTMMMPLSDRLIFNPAGPDRLMACWEFYATAKNTQNYFDLSLMMFHQQLPKIPKVIDFLHLKFRQRLHLLHWPLIYV